ncbi:ABC transporter permease [Blastococcus xanthinilyticus]|uniref:Peptide/nickel transport system permease protein n=1 Tax=Blastococcus xanthinilyticus TaxID=1564164 RepID=A0A5S5D395_9ACTN|nr:ABC transporter permease [Blastococcus xanthinilyticus]TYP90507.1 peptide/nickel transport system permease protein [Blastococcus xanthinilyticus]
MPAPEPAPNRPGRLVGADSEQATSSATSAAELQAGQFGNAAATTEPSPEPAQRRRRRKAGVLFYSCLAWLVLVVVVAITAPWLPIPGPDAIDIPNRQAPPFTAGHLLGTDGLGRDIASRLAYGARVSLIISIAAVVTGIVVGGTLGMVVGYFRGRIETVVMAAVDVILAFPALVLLLALVAFVGQSLTAITAVIAFVSIPFYARVARATTLAVSQREYVLAAGLLGARTRRILFREIMPNVILPVAAFGLIALGVVIVLEGSLAFLGLSVQAPAATWGSMIAEGRRYLDSDAHIALIPSVVMFLTVLSLNFVGDVLRSRFDVREANL